MLDIPQTLLIYFYYSIYAHMSPGAIINMVQYYYRSFDVRFDRWQRQSPLFIYVF